MVRHNIPENHHQIGTGLIVVLHAIKAVDKVLLFYSVWHELGQYFHSQSKYDDAKAAFTNALLIKKISFVDDHPSLAQSIKA